MTNDKKISKIKKMHFVLFLEMAQKEKEKEKEIDFKKETFISFENEIRFLEKEGSILLAQIQIQEEYMSKKQKVDRYDLNELQEMIEKFLRLLSLVDAYQYFQSKNEILSDENLGNFLFIVNNDYSVRINKFINDLKMEMKVDKPNLSRESYHYTMKIYL